LLIITPANPTFLINEITKTYGDAAFTVAATSDSPGAITYSITSGSQFASITPNGLVTIVGAGVVTISANQAASGSYSAGSTTATLTITKANAVLTYTGPVSGNISDILTLSASSTSTGGITFSVLTGGTGTGAISGVQLALGAAGSITIQITAAGDDNYLAQTITQEITILSVTSVVNGTLSNSQLNVFPNPAYDYANVELALSESTKGSLVLCDMNGKIVYVIAEGNIDNQATYYVPMAEFANGVYVVKLMTEKGSLIMKLVK